MVPAGIPAQLCIHTEICYISRLNHTVCHLADMADLTTTQLDGLFHLKDTGGGADLALISLLTTHRRIERRLLHDDRADLSVGKRLHQLCLGGEHCDL